MKSILFLIEIIISWLMIIHFLLSLFFSLLPLTFQMRQYSQMPAFWYHFLRQHTHEARTFAAQCKYCEFTKQKKLYFFELFEMQWIDMETKKTTIKVKCSGLFDVERRAGFVFLNEPNFLCFDDKLLMGWNKSESWPTYGR